MELRSLFYPAAVAVVLLPQTALCASSTAGSAIKLPEACRAAVVTEGSSMMPGMHKGMMDNMGQGMQHGVGKEGGQDGQGMMGKLDETQQGLHQAMMAMQEPMMTGMMAPNPDVAWICSMIPHHQGAIDMARAGLKRASNAESKKFAEETIAAQEKEIAKLTAWVEKYAAKEIKQEQPAAQ